MEGEVDGGILTVVLTTRFRSLTAGLTLGGKGIINAGRSSETSPGEVRYYCKQHVRRQKRYILGTHLLKSSQTLSRTCISWWLQASVACAPLQADLDRQQIVIRISIKCEQHENWNDFDHCELEGALPKDLNSNVRQRRGKDETQKTSHIWSLMLGRSRSLFSLWSALQWPLLITSRVILIQHF